jgi:hypothetical protein
MDYLVLYSKQSSCSWAHTSGWVGSNDRSTGLPVGRARLLGTAETLVGGDPWVPMSHKLRDVLSCLSSQEPQLGMMG